MPRESRALFRSFIATALLFGAAFALRSGFAVCPPACGLAFTVDSTDDTFDDVSPGDGQCNDGHGHCTLRAAIEEANAHAGDDGIFFNIPTTDPGYNAGTWTINLRPTRLPLLSTNIAITGPGADMLIVRPDSHIIASSFHVFDVTASGTVSFTALTISYGIGAGIQNQGAGTVNITDTTLSNSGSTDNGGGVLNNGTGDVNIDHSTLANNRAGNGGGVYNNSTGHVTITDSTLSGNHTSNGVLGNGGGFFNNGGGSITIIRCLVTSNTSSLNGGGIYNNAGAIDVTSSTVSGNAAMLSQGSSSGGAIFNNGTVYVTNSTVSGNSAAGGYDSSGNIAGKASGGGIFNSNGATITISNSTLSGNLATGAKAPSGGTFTGGTSFGGGIANAGTLNLTASTISNNHAVGGTSGGGLAPAAAVGGGIAGSGTNNVKSSVIALNTATFSGPDVNDTFVSAGFNLIGKRNGSSGFTAATDQTGTVASPLDPKLDPAGLKDNGGPTQTIALLVGSPAIDKAIGPTASLGPPTDQRGATRTLDYSSVPNATGGDGTDIGAFEFEMLAVISIVRGGNGNNDVVITFGEAIKGQTYRLERSAGPTFQTLSAVFDLAANSGSNAQITDPGAINLGKAFYRVHRVP